MSNTELAEKIRKSDTWEPELVHELCARAGLAEAYEKADGESFETVVNNAAGILGVQIY